MDEAEFFLRRLIDIRELALGKDHPEVDSALNKLVQMCLRKEKFKAAELLFKRILESNLFLLLFVKSFNCDIRILCI